MTTFKPRAERRTRFLAGVGLVSLVVGLTMAVAPSQADTTTPVTTTATVLDGAGNPTSQANVAPNGPLTGLANGTRIRVTMTGPAGKFFGADARLCRSGANIASSAQFNPGQSGNCIDAPFNAESDDFVQANAAPSNTSVTFEFRVGTGSRTVTYNSGASSRVITCGDASPCELWFKQSMDVEAQPAPPAGLAFVHYNLVYGAGSGITTTSSTATTSTTAPTTTSSTTAASTTSTSSSSTSSTSATSTTKASTTTSSTAAGGTTTTGAGGTTTSTAAGGTTTSTGTGGTTTTAGGPLTVSPSSLAPGGTINVTSSGWKPATQVTVGLNSNPVTLGTITADASGRANGSFTVPAGHPLGSHTVTLTGTGAGGESRTLNAPITLVGSAALSRTGTEAWRFSMVSIALVLLGVSLLLLSAAQRRQRWTA